MMRAERQIVFLVALGAFALGMDAYATAGLLPSIESVFKVPVGLAAQLVTAFTIAYGIGSPVLVALCPARHQRTWLLGALLIFVLANIGSALSTRFDVLVLFRAIAGAGAGVYLATGISASATLSGPDGRSRAIAVIMGGMASGTVLGVPLALLLANRYGWSAALWLIAVLGAAAWAGLLCLLPALQQQSASSLLKKLRLIGDWRVVGVLSVSLLAALSSLGLYTFMAPLLDHVALEESHSVAPFLWAWGVGGVAGSLLVAPIASRLRAAWLTLWIMLILAGCLFALPMLLGTSGWLVMVPIVLWGAVGWALQVPQNDELLRAREQNGDGHLAVALNESALYLGSAIGAAGGGWLLLQGEPVAALASAAGGVAALGAFLQVLMLVFRPSSLPVKRQAFGEPMR